MLYSSSLFFEGQYRKFFLVLTLLFYTNISYFFSSLTFGRQSFYFYVLSIFINWRRNMKIRPFMFIMTTIFQWFQGKWVSKLFGYIEDTHYGAHYITFISVSLVLYISPLKGIHFMSIVITDCNTLLTIDLFLVCSYKYLVSDTSFTFSYTLSWVLLKL